MSLYQITAPHFSAGICIDPKEGVYKSAPILGFMCRWSLEQIEEYCRLQKWDMKLVQKERKVNVA